MNTNRKRKSLRYIMAGFFSLAAVVAFSSTFLVLRFGAPQLLSVVLPFLPKMVHVEQTVPVAASLDHSAWIRDGKVFLSGEPYPDQDKMSEWDDLVQVAISDDHVVVLDSTGHVFAGGSDMSQECQINGLSGAINIAAGMNCSAAVLFNGRIRIFGVLDEARQQGLLSETNARQVAIGDDLAAVLRSDGTAAVYVRDGVSSDIDVSGWKNLREIRIGKAFAVGLDVNGKVFFSGEDTDGQKECDTWIGITSVTAGSSSVAGIKRNGTVCGAGRNRKGELDLDDWKGVTALASSYDHTVGITKDGTMLASGYNGKGQCEIPS